MTSEGVSFTFTEVHEKHHCPTGCVPLSQERIDELIEEELAEMTETEESGFDFEFDFEGEFSVEMERSMCAVAGTQEDCDKLCKEPCVAETQEQSYDVDFEHKIFDETQTVTEKVFYSFTCPAGSQQSGPNAKNKKLSTGALAGIIVGGVVVVIVGIVGIVLFTKSAGAAGTAGAGRTRVIV